MSRWYRSERMEYISLIVNEDASRDCLSNLGKLGIVQFTDINPDVIPSQRRFVNYVRRCHDIERKLRFFIQECQNLNLEIAQTSADVDVFLEGLSAKDGGAKILEKLETQLEGYEEQLKELNKYNEKLSGELEERQELEEVLSKARKFFMRDGHLISIAADDDGDNHENEGNGLRNPLTVALLEGTEEEEINGEEQVDMRFSTLTGIIATDEKTSFERMVYRVTRGNCFVRFAPITNPQTGEPLPKAVFILYYKSSIIETKLKTICDSFQANRYTIPDLDDAPAVFRMMSENAEDIRTSTTILKKNETARLKLCKMLAENTERWMWIVLKEKAIYHSLNMFKADVQGVLRGEGWVIASKLNEFKDVVEKAHAKIDVAMPSLVDHVPKPWPTPPTHFSTNKFTYGYQEFVNTYGIPRYREANPALFTAATFPFLFGVMYGDIGHGMFLFSAGLYLLYNEKANDKAKLGEMFGGMHAGRYMITMMGFFAIYSGCVYNDMFSMGVNLFGSRWRFPGQDIDEVALGAVGELKSHYGAPNSVYPFGIDPVWYISSNELLFSNSFKMKLSVILGITQMFAGTCIKGANAIYFGEKYDFFFEFIPMVLFASSLFVYMVFLIFYKWATNWNSRMLSATCIDPNGAGWGSDDYQEFDGNWIICDQSGNGKCTPWGYSCTGSDTLADLCPLDFGGAGDGCDPPNLITTLIDIALQPGVVAQPMFNRQAMIQNILLLIALVSVPILLFCKPYFIAQDMKKNSSIQNSTEVDDAGEEDDGEDHDGDHGFGEIFIHQVIETIEFVLGMVSNTASYLRLWALSLAHSELASVFWQKAMITTLELNFFATFLGFAVFAGTTLGVLLMMDVLECFLHALRLHWVEFQNKFFKADGVRFAPYSFKQIIVDASATM